MNKGGWMFHHPPKPEKLKPSNVMPWDDNRGGDTTTNEEEEEKKSPDLLLPTPEKCPPNEKKVMAVSASGSDTGRQSTKKPAASVAKKRVGGEILVGTNIKVAPPPRCPLDINIPDNSDMIGLSVDLVGMNTAQHGRSCDAHRVCGNHLEVGQHFCFVKERFAWQEVAGERGGGLPCPCSLHR
jgi:hypothetical protein